MVDKILNNIQQFLIDCPINTIQGNIVVGKGELDKYCIEIRYVYNKDIFFQHLVDDIWDEEKVWGDEGITFTHRIILYICHKSINIAFGHFLIENELNLSQFFTKTDKYYINSTPEIDNAIDIDKSIINDQVTNTISPLTTDKNGVNISVITVVYNNALLLEQTIQSVINQSNKNFEYIIKDAESTDNFCEIVKKYRQFISKIISKPDNGIYYGMQEGVDAANGRYIAFLNSDDIYYSHDVIKIYDENISKNSADAYYANMLMRKNSSEYYLRKGSIQNIYRESSINHPTLFLKRKLFYELGGFDLFLKYAADGDITIKLLKSGCTFFYLDKTIVLFRLGGASSVNYRGFIEDIICRYRFKKLNIVGYLFIIFRSIKNIFIGSK